MKKKLGVVVISAMIFALLAACGTSNNQATSSPSASSSQSPASSGGEQATESKTPDPVEIVIWDKIKDDDPAKEIKQQIQDDFAEKYPYIKVKHEAMAEGNDRQVFMTAMAGGQGPDAYQSAHFPIIGDWIKQGLALDLSEYWANYADKDKFIASAMEYATVDGKVYGLPYSMYVMGLFYNKDHFTDAGLDPEKAPATWEEFVEYGKLLSVEDGSRYAYALLGMDWADWYFEYYVWQAGGDLTTKNSDGTVTLDFSKEPTVKALQYYQDLKWKHNIVQKNVLQSYDENMTDFMQGRASMVVTSHQWIPGFIGNGMNFGFAPMPTGPAGIAPSQAGGAFWIINPKTSKEKQDAAWTYITYMMSKEVLEKQMKFAEDEGQVAEMLPVRTDVDPGQFTSNISSDLLNNIRKVAEDTHLEYYLKEQLGTYVTKAVQQVLTDKNVDAKKALEDVEKLAQSEVVDAYNEEVKKGN